MRNKIFKYGIPTGLFASCIGLTLFKTDLIDIKVYNSFYDVYQLTLFLSIIFVFTKSTFINRKFKQLFLIIGISFSITLGMNLLNEFNIYDVGGIKIIGSTIITSLFALYLFHFSKKSNRNNLDYLKLVFVLFAIIGAFLKILEIAPNNFKYLTGGLFWITILGMILFNYSDWINERIKN